MVGWVRGYYPVVKQAYKVEDSAIMTAVIKSCYNEFSNRRG